MSIVIDSKWESIDQWLCEQSANLYECFGDREREWGYFFSAQECSGEPYKTIRDLMLAGF